jgi:cell division protein FtsL
MYITSCIYSVGQSTQFLYAVVNTLSTADSYKPGYVLLHLLSITAVHLSLLYCIFAATVLLVAMAASESSGLVTKATVILKKPSDWQEWLFLRRDKATLNGI